MTATQTATITERVRPREAHPARQVDMRRAARLGLAGGVTVVFVAAIGMVDSFSGRDILGNTSLATALLLAVPFVFGYAAGQPPARIEGFAAAPPGWRSPGAGALAGLLIGVVVAAFVVLIVNVNLREYFINITPSLASEDPRLLLYGQTVGPGLPLLVAVDAAVAAGGAALHLLDARRRRAILSGILWVVAFALLQPFIQQVLRGIRAELNIETDPLNRLLYSGGSLRPGAAVLVFLLGVAGHLFARRPARTTVRQRLDRMPARSQRVVAAAAGLVALLAVQVLPSILGSFLSEVLSIAGIYVLMALGLNIVVGYAGLLDLGYVAFFAVGAYTTAIMASPIGGLELGWAVWATVPFVLVAAALAGILVGTPVLRMRGDYLAIVTLGFGEIARLLFLSDWLAPTFGGAQGITRIPDLTIGPVEIQGSQAFLYPLLGLILLAAYVSFALQGSRIGRAWMAMREDESVAEAVGVNIVAAKLSAFVVGAVLAGLGGALFATKIGSIFPNSLDLIVSITVLVVVIVGGMASIPGVVLGAVVLVGLPELLREFEDYRFLIYGALLIFMMLRRPEGFIPSRRRAQELHEADISQDAWLRARADGADDGAEEGAARGG